VLLHEFVTVRNKDIDVAWTTAYEWLCHQRKDFPPDADIWHLRWKWPTAGQALYQQVICGRYTLSPMQVYNKTNSQAALWSSEDALVLKWVALNIKSKLPVRENCMQFQGAGRCVQHVAEARYSGNFQFMFRTDIRGYYRHIRKLQVMRLMQRFISDPVQLGLIRQYVFYSVENGGEFHTPDEGIPRGCSLSPLIGGSLLHHIDSYFASFDREELFYVRYMDDFLLFTRRRWLLRRTRTQLHLFFEDAAFETHPDKTQIGKLENGFDWFGLWFGAEGAAISPRVLTNHHERHGAVYQHGNLRTKVQAYEELWSIWAKTTLTDAFFRSENNNYIWMKYEKNQTANPANQIAAVICSMCCPNHGPNQ
jgi:hypothetical protein